MSLAATTSSAPSTPENMNNTNGTTVRLPSLSELSEATMADESSMTDTQRRIARRRVLEARARATMAELDTLTKSFQHLSPSSGTVSAPVTPVRGSASAVNAAAYSSTPLGTSSTGPTSVTSAAAAATAAVRVRDVLLLSRNGQKKTKRFKIKTNLNFDLFIASNSDVDEENLQAFDTRDVASRLEAERNNNHII
jgi:hypothetical protein